MMTNNPTEEKTAQTEGQPPIWVECDGCGYKCIEESEEYYGHVCQDESADSWSATTAPVPATGEEKYAPKLYILVKLWQGCCDGTEIALTKEEIAAKWYGYTHVDLLKYNNTVEEQPNPYETDEWFGTEIQEKDIDEKFFQQLMDLHRDARFVEEQRTMTHDAPQEEDDTKFTEDQRDIEATKADSLEQRED